MAASRAECILIHQVSV